jgi:hypothetical protein
LHRLLAFDPTNECRGIFSDWFRFPSCCVCKCYLTEEEVALHYRNDINLPVGVAQQSSNRSPRGMSGVTGGDEEEEFDFDDQPDVDGVAPVPFFYLNRKHGGSSISSMPRRK